MKNNNLTYIVATLVFVITLTVCREAIKYNSDTIENTKQQIDELESKEEISSVSTLEEYLLSNGMLEELNEDLTSECGTNYESIVCSVEGNDIKFVYKYKENIYLDKEATEANEATLETAADTVFKFYGEELGLAPKSVTYIVLHNSGEEVYSYVRTLEEYQAAQWN